MRLQSDTKVTVRGKVIGGPDPVICLPLVAKNRSEVLQQAEKLKRFDPDLVEWRIDAYENVAAADECVGSLKSLRQTIGDIPLILTCRIEPEGGFKAVGADTRLRLIQAAIASGQVDLVDVEMCNDSSFVKSVKETAGRHGTKLILSYHNFDHTPDEAFVLNKLIQAQDLGGDIAKVAVMPKNYQDVLTLLGATLKARTEYLKIPIITMSMGSEGGVTRVAGGLFGSDLTFAVGKESSAPGQMPIGDLRRAMAVLYDLKSV